jgi:hypothetical protein
MDSSLSKPIDDAPSAQQNILVPDIKKNASGVDDFLWHGAQDATRVQRIGAVGIGILLICCGLSSAFTATRQHYLFEIVLTLAFVSAGPKVASNGFRKSKKRKRKTFPPEKSPFR